MLCEQDAEFLTFKAGRAVWTYGAVKDWNCTEGGDWEPTNAVQ